MSEERLYTASRATMRPPGRTRGGFGLAVCNNPAHTEPSRFQRQTHANVTPGQQPQPSSFVSNSPPSLFFFFYPSAAAATVSRTAAFPPPQNYRQHLQQLLCSSSGFYLSVSGLSRSGTVGSTRP